jgi:hypothetical protein
LLFREEVYSYPEVSDHVDIFDLDITSCCDLHALVVIEGVLDSLGEPFLVVLAPS